MLVRCDRVGERVWIRRCVSRGDRGRVKRACQRVYSLCNCRRVGEGKGVVVTYLNCRRVREGRGVVVTYLNCRRVREGSQLLS